MRWWARVYQALVLAHINDPSTTWEIQSDMRTPSLGEKIQHGLLICLGSEQRFWFCCLIKLGWDLSKCWAAAKNADQAITPNSLKNEKFLFWAVASSDIRQLTSVYHGQNPKIWSVMQYLDQAHQNQSPRARTFICFSSQATCYIR